MRATPIAVRIVEKTAVVIGSILVGLLIDIIVLWYIVN